MEILTHLLTPNPYSRPQNKMQTIKGLIIHWVANPKSRGISNRNYFENLKNTKDRYASSHYIIGLDGEIILCVPENEVAYHAGNLQVNSSYIGIECCHPDAGGKFNDKTYASLIKLSADILKRYGVRDIKRHYDITGKNCPKYYVENLEAWNDLVTDILIFGTEEPEETKMTQEEFNKMLDEAIKRYKTIGDCPDWAKPTVKKLIDKGFLKGDGKNLDLSLDMIRILVVHNEAGMYD